MESILGLPLPVKDPILIFGICMVVILATPLLFERFRLPGLIGPIIAGVVLGSSVLNVLERGQAIELLGNVGLLYIIRTYATVTCDRFAREQRSGALTAALAKSVRV